MKDVMLHMVGCCLGRTSVLAIQYAAAFIVPTVRLAFFWRILNMFVARLCSSVLVNWSIADGAFNLFLRILFLVICHSSILVLALLFLWSNAHTFIHKTPPHIPVVHLPEEPFLEFASTSRIEINRGFSALRDIGSGRDLKTFLSVVVGLWILSKLGNWANFLTLFYITFVLLHTVPFVYNKYEDKIDPLAEKAFIEIKKQYAVFDAKVLSKVLNKIPIGSLKGKLA